MDIYCRGSHIFWFYFLGDYTSANALDIKNRGSNTTKKGSIVWFIDNSQHLFVDGNVLYLLFISYGEY